MIGQLSKSERDVLEYFVRKPGQTHVRGLSKETDIPYSTVQQALQELEEQGVLEKEEKGSMTFYSPNETVFRNAKRLINLERLQDSGLIAHLETELRPDAIVLFGSYLDGRDRSESDIDIAVIGGRDTEPSLDSFETELGRDIHLVEVDAMKEEDEAFQNTLANGLTLSGYLEIV